MKFATTHKLASYLMVLSSFAAVAFSGELGPVTVLLFLASLVPSWFWEQPRVNPGRWTMLGSIVSILSMAYAGVEVANNVPFVVALSKPILVLLVAKLFHRVTTRDYLWIYVLTFAVLLAGATLNGRISYGLCFLVYTIATTWALILCHLRREIEGNYLFKHTDESTSVRVEVERILASRRVIGRSFLVGTLFISLGVYCAAMLFFALIPRFSFGISLQRSRLGIIMAGFQDGVTLGGHGTIKDDRTVVMRVFLDRPAYRGPGGASLRFRGVSFDSYENGKWSRSDRAFPTSVAREYGAMTRNVRLYLDTSEDEARRIILSNRLVGTVKQEIFLEPMETTVLFAASRPIAFELTIPGILPDNRNLALEQSKNDELRYHRYTAIKYTAYSDPSPPPEDKLVLAADTKYAAVLSPYLQLPANLPSRVIDLAKAITVNATGPYQKALAIQNYLAASYRYTVEIDSDPAAEPLDHFLFQRKQGHCEYFASAMAVLLRAVDVPTRSVNGFRGGEWNDYGGYMAVRAGDAHSWIEVWLDTVGWVTFDPTPPGGQVSRRSGLRRFLTRMGLIVDTFHLKWLQWVVDYDLGQQATLLRQAANFFRVTGKLRRSLSASNVKATLRRHLGSISLGVVLV
ncbi:MAG: DUF3488 and transglutaminase-like domain-containing protein, partial [Pseudomonadota bacterium]